MFNKNYIRAQTTEDIRKENLRKSQKAKNLSIGYRYPRTFVALFTISSVLVFFSKPLYDIFFVTEDPRVERDIYPKNFRTRWLREAIAAKEEKENERLKKLREFELTHSVNGSSEESQK